MSTARVRRGASVAVRRALDELRPINLPIDPYDLARRWGIQVITQPLAEPDAIGCLEHLGGLQFRIEVADTVRADAEHRFTVAHELGHCCLEGHAERMFGIGMHRHISRHQSDEADHWEIEADLFARELLMPIELCQPLVAQWDRIDPGWGTIQRLATACQTTVAAAAARYPRLTRLPAATFTSHACRIENGLLSAVLRRRLGWPSHRAVRGHPLPPHTPGPEQTTRAPAHRDTQWLTVRRVPWTSWFGGVVSGWAQEICHWLGVHGQVLTVLTEMPT